MRLLNRISLLILLVFTTYTALSQGDESRFTVQIGSFINPKTADFSQLASTGFVYGKGRPTGYVDIFIGGYSSETEAERVAQTVKKKGYDNAFVSKINVEGGQTVTIIQLAMQTTGEKINWEALSQAGPLYVILNGSQIKIVTGTFEDADAAKAELPRLKALGYNGAFVKNVNNAILHDITDFETGGLAKKALIPLDFTQKPAPEEKKTDVPASYEDVAIIAATGGDKRFTEKGIPPAATEKAVPKKETPVITQKEAPKEAASKEVVKIATPPAPKSGSPAIRADVKRTSAIELQKVLKLEGTYKGSLDGYYGKGTRSSYEMALNSNRQLQKYRILSRHMAQPESDAPRGSVQYFINKLWDDPKTALDGLEASKAPIAKAYRAYFLFVNDGASRDVNTLMNAAIKDAFAGQKTASFAKFDPTATYAYFDLDQLLLHMRYIHQVSADKPAAPCWLFRKHSGPALKAFEPTGSSTDAGLQVQNCGGFWEWEEVQLLNAIAQDMAGQGQRSEAKMSSSQSELSRLYLTPKAVDDNTRKSLETWNNSLWKGIDAWSTRDPMFAELSTALKISYFQTQVLFEDYFMDQGFNEREAKSLALAALKALAGADLERFI